MTSHPVSIKNLRNTRIYLALAHIGFCAASLQTTMAIAAENTDNSDNGTTAQVVIKATVEKKKLSDSVSSGALGRRSKLDTPFSTKAVSSAEIEDRLATSVSEVFKYDASVTAISPPISTHPATIQMRGLRLDDLNGYKIDGLANINRGTEMPLEMFVTDGQNRYQGLEFNSVVQAAKNLSIEGGIMLLDATLQNAAPAYSGKRAVGAPRRQASLQLTWRPEALTGLALHAGTQYLGELPMDAGNVNTLPAYELFDAGLNYRTRIGNQFISLRANVSNIANRKYWTYYQENYLNVGAPRTVSLSARVDF